MTDHKPWWLSLTKEISGLGLVLVMLFGLYLLGDRYLEDMRDTTLRIHEIAKLEVEQRKQDRTHIEQVITAFMSNQDARMLEIEKRLGALEGER